MNVPMMQADLDEIKERVVYEKPVSPEEVLRLLDHIEWLQNELDYWKNRSA